MAWVNFVREGKRIEGEDGGRSEAGRRAVWNAQRF